MKPLDRVNCVQSIFIVITFTATLCNIIYWHSALSILNKSLLLSLRNEYFPLRWIKESLLHKTIMMSKNEKRDPRVHEWAREE